MQRTSALGRSSTLISLYMKSIGGQSLSSYSAANRRYGTLGNA